MSEQSKYIRCAKWETCQQQCASGAKSPFPAYNRIYAPPCFVEQPAEPGTQMMICLRASERLDTGEFCGSRAQHERDSYCDTPKGSCPACVPVDESPPFHGVYPGIVRPPPDVEQASYPAPLDLEEITERNLDRSEWGTAKRDVSNLVAEILNLRAEGNVLKAALAETHDGLDLCQGEVERLRKGQSADGTERGLMLLALMAELEQVRQQRDELYTKLDEIADEPLPGRQYRCSGAETCTEMDCPLMKAHEPGTHANCGMLHFCGWVFEDVRCVEVTE